MIMVVQKPRYRCKKLKKRVRSTLKYCALKGYYYCIAPVLLPGWYDWFAHPIAWTDAATVYGLEDAVWANSPAPTKSTVPDVAFLSSVVTA